MKAPSFSGTRFHQLASPGDDRGVSCDGNGPAIGPIKLLVKTGGGFAPRPIEELNRDFGSVFGRPLDCTGLASRLGTVARAMNEGEIARALFATQYLHLPTLTDDEAARAKALVKASADDPQHPGWPKGTEGGKGGQFRPKDGAAGETTDRLMRRLRRREIRTALRHILLQRAGRLAIEAVGDAIPGAEILAGAATIADFSAMTEEYAALKRETDAAGEFVHNGPYSLEQLRVSSIDESFSTFDEFKKISLAKRFGPAGDGYEYHHIVEQNGSGDIPETELQSTNNIVRIPRLLHEEISSAFSRLDGPEGVSIRDGLRGESFETRWDEGLSIMERIGILRKGDR